VGASEGPLPSAACVYCAPCRDASSAFLTDDRPWQVPARTSAVAERMEGGVAMISL